jgi:hypothetical protein
MSAAADRRSSDGFMEASGPTNVGAGALMANWRLTTK